MKFSVFTASTPEWSIDEAIVRLSAHGWHGIELRVIDQEPSPEASFWTGNRATVALTGLEAAVPRIRELLELAGVACSGIGGYTQASELDDTRRILDAAAALGAPGARVNMPRLGQIGDAREAFEQTRHDLATVAAYAASIGVKALVELHHGTLVASASAALRMLDNLDPGAVGVIHDLGNTIIEGHEDHASSFELLGAYLAHIHIKNARFVEAGTDPLGAVIWAHEWAPLDRGQASVLEYLKAAQGARYDGWIVLEDFSTQLPLTERSKFNRDFLERAWMLATHSVHTTPSQES